MSRYLPSPYEGDREMLLVWGCVGPARALLAARGGAYPGRTNGPRRSLRKGSLSGVLKMPSKPREMLTHSLLFFGNSGYFFGQPANSARGVIPSSCSDRFLHIGGGRVRSTTARGGGLFVLFSSSDGVRGDDSPDPIAPTEPSPQSEISAAPSQWLTWAPPLTNDRCETTVLSKGKANKATAVVELQRPKIQNRDEGAVPLLSHGFLAAVDSRFCQERKQWDGRGVLRETGMLPMRIQSLDGDEKSIPEGVGDGRAKSLCGGALWDGASKKEALPLLLRPSDSAAQAPLSSRFGIKSDKELARCGGCWSDRVKFYTGDTNTPSESIYSAPKAAAAKQVPKKSPEELKAQKEELRSITKAFPKFVEIGRIALLKKGPDAGKIVTVVDVIDARHYLVDGPGSGVTRRAVQCHDIHLTKFAFTIPRGGSTKCIRKKWEDTKLMEKWEHSKLYKKLNDEKKNYCQIEGDVKSVKEMNEETVYEDDETTGRSSRSGQEDELERHLRDVRAVSKDAIAEGRESADLDPRTVALFDSQPVLEAMSAALQAVESPINPFDTHFPSHVVTINRNVFLQSTAMRAGGFHAEVEPDLVTIIYDYFACTEPLSAYCIWNEIKSRFPVLRWIPQYPWFYLVEDTIAGLIIGFMLIPQSMGHAVIAKVPAEIGLYTSLLPPVVYFLFGTSRHISQGTYIVTWLMLGNALDETCPETKDAKVECVGLITFYVFVLQLLMFIFHLGDMVASLFSEVLLDSFITAAALHGITSQANHMMGLPKPPVEYGIGYVPRMYYALLRELSSANYIEILVAFGSLLFLYASDYVINPILKKYCRYQFPGQILVVVIGCGVSYGADLEKRGVPVLSEVKAGLPSPTYPHFSRTNFGLIGYAIMIACLSVATNFALCQLLSFKEYKTDGNQELLAYSMSNLCSCFFRGGPVAGALARSYVNKSAGARTLLGSVVSSLLILCVLLFLGPLIEPLPLCTLSAVIVAAMTKLLFRVQKLPTVWYYSKMDLFMWLAIFLISLLVDLIYGLISGLALQFFVFSLKLRLARGVLVGEVPYRTGIFVECEQYTAVHCGLKIFRFQGPLFFGSEETFQTKFRDCTGIDLEDVISPTAPDKIRTTAPWKPSSKMAAIGYDKVNAVIIDLSGVSFIDSTGLSMLLEVFTKLKDIGINCYFAEARLDVIIMFEKSNFYSTVDDSHLFATVLDAVEFLRHEEREAKSRRA
ncbi:unnamed protein product [Cyprideis torosa]|uniref:Large ribosomal subunit protein eL14 n=1 Tax=Cyprideis torosa TaxID=163714 RepID=A0A7R8ZN53_9CRUS|nr:unnamed protein product [Cyprideis torosa]CAG0887071.1 unnamed protein product [Cyprideis torosa]